MSITAKAEELALSPPDSDRAKLAEKLIASLPSPFVKEDDDWVEEAVRRDREMDDDPSKVITLEQLDEMIADRAAHGLEVR